MVVEGARRAALVRIPYGYVISTARILLESPSAGRLSQVVVLFSKVTVFLKLVILSTEPLHLCRSVNSRRISFYTEALL